MNRFIERKRNTDNSGTTLIETLAAFTVLAAILAILYSIVDFSGNLRTQAVDSARLDQMFWREVFQNDSLVEASSFIDTTYYMKDPPEDGGGKDYKYCRFWLVLDTERTDVTNNYAVGFKGTDEELKNNPPSFYLLRTRAAGYVCTDPLIEAEHLPVPSAMKFEYYAPVEATLP